MNLEDLDQEPEPLDDHRDPSTYFTRDGLQVATLADAVRHRIAHGVGRDGRLWVHRAGVWQPDHDEQIAATVASLLGQRYRHSHLTNVLDVLRFDQGAPRITGDPVAQYVNCASGLLHWSTGQLHPHDRGVLSTVQLPVTWNPDADCPQFLRFLSDVLPPDCLIPMDDGPGFIWELLGYLVHSGNPLHVAILLLGSGRNGKGTWLRALNALLGEPNTSAVALHDLVTNRFRVSTLFGRLANVAGDLDAKSLETTALFKAITGGDKVTAELKYGAVWDFTPWAVPVFSANRVFGTPDSSEGYFSRWVVIPFPNTFSGREDRSITAQITTPGELSGILRRAVAALPALMARGRLPEPASVAAAKHAFIIASDPVRAWLAERADLGDGWTLRTELAGDYKRWAERNDVKSMSARELYARLDTVSALRPATIGGHRGFRGLRLKAGDDD